ncbi:hypothetical protein CDG62_00060 (plasmid) [Acinetobacter sp. WCHA55]|uniref:phage tail-collar fiber domain-containing protein n=1 Tax=Acinetobacter sp. WCHA55 TaxID=2004646 RepID=UPI000B3C3A94|nr:phage tail protein [Acinetobacter sp. WCHA55]AYA66862.1 hypothetical protein CDG62_00060 [Acinetobacter sp. WCHA55]
MSDPIKLKITRAGLTAFFDARANGIRLEVDKMKYSSDNFISVPMDERTDLNNIVSESNIVASGTSIATNTIRFVTVINSNSELHVGSMGVYTKEGVLFAIASVPNGSLFKVFNGISFTATFGLTLNAQILEQINVILDPNTALAYSMVADHENHINPHPQYAMGSEVIDAINQIHQELDGLGSGQGDLGGQMIGIGQSYGNVLAQRRNDGTVYVNTTPKPIMVFMQFHCSDGLSHGIVKLDGYQIATMYANQSNGSMNAYIPISFILMPNKGYSVSGGRMMSWFEMA